MNEISVIIPTFNRANCISRAIESVLAQTKENWELIVVDDGSTDETKEIVENFLPDPRVKYIFQENHGVSAARNNGAKTAQGEYLIFLDSDDEFFPHLLEHLFQINYQQYDLICWHIIKNVDGWKFLWKPQKLGKLYKNIQFTFLAGSICYRKRIFLEANGFDAKMSFGESFELGMRIVQKSGLKLKVIEKPLRKYNIVTAERTSNSIFNRLESTLWQYQKHSDLYKQYPKEDSKMSYILGYLYEKTNKTSNALKFYQNAFSKNPLHVKALIKIIYLHLT